MSIPIAKRKRRFWVVSPNVTANPKTIDLWKKAIKDHHAAFMGWGPNNPKHMLGVRFANNISKGDVILIARRFKGIADIVGYGVVSTDESVKELKGFSAPDAKWHDGTIRKLSRFVFDDAIPARLPIMSAVNHPQSLCQLHPSWRPEHRKICDWMSERLGLSTARNETTGSKKARTKGGVSITRLTDPHQSEFTVRTRAMVRQAKKFEDVLVKAYREWLSKRGHHVDRIKYRRLVCDAYDQKRNNLIEAKSSTRREYIRMAVGQLLDYAFLGQHLFKNPHMAILLPRKPEQEIMTWLDGMNISVIWNQGKEFHDNADEQFT